MARVIVPSDAPKEGEGIYVFGGPANGRETEYTGLNLIYEEGPLKHHYILTEKVHVVLGTKMWVYDFVGTE